MPTLNSARELGKLWKRVDPGNYEVAPLRDVDKLIQSLAPSLNSKAALSRAFQFAHALAGGQTEEDLRNVQLGKIAL